MPLNNPALAEFSQHTLKSAIHCVGIGLHSGRKVRLELRPAAPDTGIVFIRSDRPQDGLIEARWNSVVDTRLCTVIGNEAGARVGTIEHLMAALNGCGIDNAEIHVDAAEVPVMDGSADPFVFLINAAGIQIQDADRRALEILRPVSVSEGDVEASYTPSSERRFSFEIQFADRAIGQQRHSLLLEDGNFQSEVANCRTFGFLKDAEALRAAGLGLGGSMENAVIVDSGRVLNPEGLRRPDEFVRHKVLDAVGDTYLAGGPVLGHYHGFKAGHRITNKLLHAVYADPANYRIVRLRNVARTGAAELAVAGVAS
ncbi:UDP-3-O-acyl-N-acetylglucosamine deacetylase [Radicibacter daui]|uniref:UDP-3-O-acyl-N-acetylglucosamine deacetylase n=1 Tax=Radicibacter daui TaxID=3064829 RepID=UPI0040468DEF